MLAIEIWKPIFGYEGKYGISNIGRIKSLPKKRVKCRVKGEIVLTPTKGFRGCMVVSLYNGKKKTFAVDNLIYKHFI